MKIKQKHLINNNEQLKQICAGVNTGKGSAPKQQSVAIDYPSVTIIPDDFQGG
ncbi:hypothetical protein [Pseudoalteromonas luteoviolacea]|uniref:Uncharacterized protein n=1 Tax=Pseudoalteromonas luteoviolacea H33 TaxID=1365251 RepID=A0A167FU12_9GAMM|nr:hypothetical protein [Pseudoalteromonas luteoviolacea]KZN52981.1 hypothetical protein N476_09355 [Pseudoalteromonas luteoviolacea H33]KZN78102.1 hypothetical protein N477_10710 [Pseudoalteromonas luteoviolacea H33-S]